MSWFKYIFITIFFVAVAIYVMFISTIHQTNVVSTQEVDFSLASVNVGSARKELDGSMNREVALANLMLKIADAHKGHKYSTEIDYVFLDEENKPTNDENNIKSVQFEVKLLDANGKVQSKSTERIEIHSLLGGD